jgi:uncharacterized protein with LGFP repeats/GH25 family lysozyme M1 (1,4-beta-N-acetylmuramidase)
MGDGVRKFEATTAAPGAASTDGSTAASTWTPPGVQGLDVSGHQPAVNWGAEVERGAKFAYVKASEGDYYLSPAFSSQFNNSYNAGLVRGSYHFAIPHPEAGTAADQARYFVANGGVWSGDGMTLPPLLDIEYNPYVGSYFGNTCYDQTPAQIVAWTREFSDTVYALTKRLPAIYTTTDWWRTCTGNNGGFSGNPLHIAAYGVQQPGILPNGWMGYDIWQYSSTGPFAGDSNVWRGTLAQLRSFAAGVTVNTGGGIGQAWLAAGGASGAWGRATSLESCGPSMCLQVFERRMAYWTAERGVLSVATSGGIGSVWRSSGAASGRFGLPTGSEACKDNYCFQTFETGDLYWSAGTGVQSIYSGTDNSTIGAYWKKQGGPSSKYGLPTTGESCAASYCAQYFERGSFFWTAATGIQPVFTNGDNSTVGGVWTKLGGINSKYGFPTSAEKCYANYCEQTFQRGRVLWSAAGGVQPVFTNGDNSTIGGLWVKSGATASRYGFPIGPETCSATSCQQRFQYGTIVWAQPAESSPLYYSNDNSTISAYYTLNLGGTAESSASRSAPKAARTACVQKFQWQCALERRRQDPARSGPMAPAPQSAAITNHWAGPPAALLPASARAVQGHHLLPAVPLRLRDLVRGYRAADGEHHEIGKAWPRPGRRRSTGVPRDREQCSGTTSCMQNFVNGTIRWTSAGGISITKNP